MSKGLKILIVVLVVLALGLAGYVAYAYYIHPSKTVTKTTPTPVATTSKPAETTVNVEKVNHVSDPGVTWLAAPEKLDDLGLIKMNDQTFIVGVDYYKIANVGTNEELILASLHYDGPGGDSYVRFKKNSQGQYKYLLKHSYEQDDANIDKMLTDKATIDPSTTYQSLSAPDFVNIKSVNFKNTDLSYGMFFSVLSNPVEISDTQYGKLYRVPTGTITDNKEGVGYSYYLELADTTLANYTIKFDFQADDLTSLVTWSDGTKNSSKYTPEGYAGCSLSSNINLIVNTKDIATRLQTMGKTSSGENVYTVSKNDAVITSAYDNYKMGRETDVMSLDEFYNKKPVFIYKDGLDEYVIFTSTEFAGLAECGKPVIYLYPTKDTNVTVKVGAEITKSEPLYGNGWNVLAEPSGKLHLGSKSYDSLFWEGFGIGSYPVASEGFVVKKENIESTLKDHLVKLGLNQKESADFMEFWLPKMPNTSYTRLTWFGTREMDNLAPLSVTPKPDTTIRIFLDFEGLNNPINIKPQTLSSIPRKGFTLVEWGGLLRGETK